MLVMSFADAGGFGAYPEPIPTICSILQNPIAQAAVQWEQGGQCMAIMGYRVCPSEQGIEAADTATFMRTACAQGGMATQCGPGMTPTPSGGCMPIPMPPTCPPGQYLTSAGACASSSHWYQKWQTWAIGGAALVGGALLLSSGKKGAA